MLNKMDYAVSAGFSEAEEKLDLIKKELVKNISEQFRERKLVFNPLQEYIRNKTFTVFLYFFYFQTVFPCMMIV